MLAGLVRASEKDQDTRLAQAAQLHSGAANHGTQMGTGGGRRRGTGTAREEESERREGPISLLDFEPTA
jgi:hypothetical protein